MKPTVVMWHNGVAELIIGGVIMSDINGLMETWQLNLSQVRKRMYRAATARERERWHALWLLARGWSARQVAEALERDPHTIGDWLGAFRESGPKGLVFEQTGGSPPSLAKKSRRR